MNAAAPEITLADPSALEQEIADLQAQLGRLKAADKPKRARTSLIDFAQHMMPSPDAPDDWSKSRYDARRPHRAIAAVLEEVEAGRFMRVIINCPPRHGKTQLASRNYIPWFVGKDPYRSVIFATYSEEYAVDIGREVRETIQSEEYRRVFPRMELRVGSASSQRLVTKEGGAITFVGRGGALTGRGADSLVIDDPIKDDEEAQSPVIRNKLWDWFTRVAMTRLMTTSGRVVIIQTRWHEDDIVGRLTDPNNPCYNVNEARKWRVVNMPALAEEGDPLKRPVGEPLWPERFTREHLVSMRELDPRGFSALYQGRPTPEDGDFFRKDYIRTYRASELPENLRYYAASDHALSMNTRKDYTVMIVAGVDTEDNIYLIDVWWRRAPTDVVVDAMLSMMKQYEPSSWYAGKDHISASIGPFLRKRMMEEHVFCVIDELTVGRADKESHAQAIRGRAAQGKLYLPSFMPWYQNAKSQMLKFPNDTHDDFVDALANLGKGLHKQIRARKGKTPDKVYPTGTFGWIKADSARSERAKWGSRNASGF